MAEALRLRRWSGRVGLGLRGKFLLAPALITLVSVSLIFVVSLQIARQSLLMSLQARLELQARLTTNLLEAELGDYLTVAESLAASAETLILDRDASIALIQRSLERNPRVFGATLAYEPYQFEPETFYWAPYFSRSTGDALQFTQLGTPAYHYFGQEWYELSVNSQQRRLSEPYFDQGGGNIWMVSWSVPFFNADGRVRGVATADISFEATQALVERMEVGEQGFAFLIDRFGTLLATSQSSPIGEPFKESYLRLARSANAQSWLDLLGQMLARGMGFQSAMHPNGQTYYVAYIPVGLDTSWSLGLAFSEAELFAPLWTMQNALAGILVVALLSMASLLYFFTHSIINPLKRLSTWAWRITSGETRLNETAVPHIRTGDEVEELSHAFEQMTRELLDLLESLEQRVNERTQQLSEAKEVAEQSDRAKSQFLASVSHELRTPLNAIINFSQFLVKGMVGDLTDEQRYLSQQILESGNTLLALINEILDISKIQSGALRLFVEEGVDVLQEACSALMTCKPLIGDKPIVWREQLPDNLPTIVADRRRVRQIMLNLLANACKFTQAGEILVIVEQHGQELRFQVRDTGPGIDETEQARLFELFQQGSAGLSQGEGTGLGLVISRRLAEAHDGSLTVASTLGHGATFTLTLPINNARLRQMLEKQSS